MSLFNKKSLKKWLRGLISAAVSGGAASIAVIIVDPATFNLTEGLRKVVTVGLISSLIGVANYLKKSPIPD